MKKHSFLFVILSISILYTCISCDSNVAKSYPSWFDEYSGDRLADLKTVQDHYACFGDTIGSNVIIYGSPMSDITYTDTGTSKQYMVMFGTRDNSDLVDSTDIQPFKDAVLANGFVYDAGNDNYVKGNIEINIYVIAMSGDPHFELEVEETY